MSNILFKGLSIFISLVFFMFYLFIVTEIFNQDLLGFPFIILTAYIAICTITFPFIAGDDIWLDDKPVASARIKVLLKFFIAPVLLFKK